MLKALQIASLAAIRLTKLNKYMVLPYLIILFLTHVIVLEAPPNSGSTPVYGVQIVSATRVYEFSSPPGGQLVRFRIVILVSKLGVMASPELGSLKECELPRKR